MLFPLLSWVHTVKPPQCHLPSRDCEAPTGLIYATANTSLCCCKLVSAQIWKSLLHWAPHRGRQMQSTAGFLETPCSTPLDRIISLSCWTWIPCKVPLQLLNIAQCLCPVISYISVTLQIEQKETVCETTDKQCIVTIHVGDVGQNCLFPIKGVEACQPPSNYLYSVSLIVLNSFTFCVIFTFLLHSYFLLCFSSSAVKEVDNFYFYNF